MASTVSGTCRTDSLQIGNLVRYRWTASGAKTAGQSNMFSGGGYEDSGAHGSDFYISSITGLLVGGRIKTDPALPVTAGCNISLTLGVGDSNLDFPVDILESQGGGISAADGLENFLFPTGGLHGSNIAGQSNLKPAELFLFDETVGLYASGISGAIVVELYAEKPWTADGR